MKVLVVDVKAAPVITQGVGWLAAIALEAGAEVGYLETTSQGPAAMAAVVTDWPPDWLWVSTMTMTLPHAGRLVTALKPHAPAMRVLLGGLGPTSAATATLAAYPAVDAVSVGEGEDCVRAILDGRPFAEVPTLAYRAGASIRKNPVGPPPDLATLPPFPYGLFPRDQVVTPQGIGYVNATRGCPFNCLAGDTVVNTLYGDIPIRELAETHPDGIPVYTYNRATGRVELAWGGRIRRYGVKDQLVRVHFDDDTFIDCTPDHRFLVFSYKNQVAPVEGDTEVEAQHLQPKQQVRAYKLEASGPKGYPAVRWARRKRQGQHRMIMEYLLGRKLASDEVVHHKDHNPRNNHPDNLALLPKAVHVAHHNPERAAWMQAHPPAKHMTPAWREQLRVAITGKRRSPEPRARMRAAALRRAARKRDAVVNHKVVRVERLEQRGDTYCLTVEGYGWFFANNVLVANCTYCANGVLLRTYGRDFVRARPIPHVLRDLQGLIRDYGVSFLQFTDEMALAKPAYAAELFQAIHDQIGLGYGIMARPEALTDEMVAILVTTGCQYLGIGVECGDETFRRQVLNRNMKNRDLIAAFQRTKRAGIFRSAYTMIGYPVPEDAQLTAATMALLDACEPDYAQFTIFYPFPATKLYEKCLKEDLVDRARLDQTVSYYQESVIKGKTVTPIVELLNARYNPRGYPFVPTVGASPAADAHIGPAAGPLAVPA